MMDMNERSEEASPKKQAKAKKEGKVAYSSDLIKTSLLMSSLILFGLLSKVLMTYWRDCFLLCISSKDEEIETILQKCFAPFVVPLLSFFALALVVVFLTSFIQQGFVFSLAKKRKATSFVFYPHLKLFVLFGMGFLLFPKIMFTDYENYNDSLKEGILSLFQELYFGALWTCVALFIIALIDVVYQRWKLNKELKMTKEEKKEEMREEAVAPFLKRRSK